ncbi:IS110 family RNA-guided transposase [Verrucomicrobiota bacterium sgz303538]
MVPSVSDEKIGEIGSGWTAADHPVEENEFRRSTEGRSPGLYSIGLIDLKRSPEQEEVEAMSKRVVRSVGKSPKAPSSAPERKSSHRGGAKAKKPKSVPVKPKDNGNGELEIRHPDAAGIDVGSRQHWVAVPRGRAREVVRCFGATTPEIEKTVGWLKECGVKEVAMESTGMYWLPLYEKLEEAGLRPILVDSRATRHVCGRKSDQSDCEWIQQLHSYGLLRAAFRPEDAICRLRTLKRHRKTLVELGAMCTQHMQKALDGMNLHLHHVLSDLTGTSGMAILDAILAGERDPRKLASMADRRVKKSPAEIEAALTGNYRHEELFVLKQSLASLRHCQQQIEECDREILLQLTALSEKCPPAASSQAAEPTPTAATPVADAAPVPAKARSKKRSEQEQALAALLTRILGVDLTEIPGLGVLAVLTLLSEIGHDMSRWRNAKAFASWLGLCPNHKVSGGRILSARSRKVINRAATVLRMAALAVARTDTPLGCFYRRKAAQFGAPKAITATARKIACLLYEMISSGTPYHAITADQYQRRYDLQRIESLRKRARQLGYELTELKEAA